ncbi:GGDEF domain-containing protein [Tropicibacter naphthalenivorans]|uniref:GGDEF domain-containing protein n=1 Tax=Tropicibacter naphthalenivorans TaxID=441103 RepID=UPI000A01769A|nr:GGDEF domain-containing protein [Tropicibacter naphthalenivorans]
MRSILRRANGLRSGALVFATAMIGAILTDYLFGWQAELLADYGAPRTNPMTLLALICAVVTTWKQRPMARVRGAERGLWLVVMALAMAHPFSEALSAAIWPTHPMGRFGWNSALTLFLIGLAHLLRYLDRSYGLIAAMIALFVPLVALNGYISGVTDFFGAMSLTTLAVQLPLALANLLCFARHPMLKGMLRDSVAGGLMRRQLQLSIALFLLIPLTLRPELSQMRRMFPLINTMEITFMLGMGLYFGARLTRLLDTERQIKTNLLTDLTLDPLTGAATRKRAVNSFLRLDVHQPAGVILCDIDHFKRVNDMLGHNAGDDALKAVVKALRSELRVTDVLARWGGEEFLIIAKIPDAKALETLTERLRTVVHRVDVPGLEEGHITCSYGAIMLDTPTGWDLRDCVAMADDALYQAKSQGRDRVVIAEYVPAAVLVDQPEERLARA